LFRAIQRGAFEPGGDRRAIAGKLETAKIAGYIMAQMLGGIAGGALEFIYYREHFKVSNDADGKARCTAGLRDRPVAGWNDGLCD